MSGQTFARVGAIVFVAVAITATAIELSRKEEPADRWSAARPVAAPTDPLREELFRCQALGEAGPRDPACRRAWAENRRRFLAPGARPAERLPDPPVAPEPAPSDPQPVEAR